MTPSAGVNDGVPGRVRQDARLLRCCGRAVTHGSPYPSDFAASRDGYVCLWGGRRPPAVGERHAVVEATLNGRREQAVLKVDLVRVSEALIESEEQPALLLGSSPVNARGDEEGRTAHDDHEANHHGGS